MAELNKTTDDRVEVPSPRDDREPIARAEEEAAQLSELLVLREVTIPWLDRS